VFEGNLNLIWDSTWHEKIKNDPMQGKMLNLAFENRSEMIGYLGTCGEIMPLMG